MSGWRTRFVAPNFSNRDLVLVFPVLSDPFCNRPTEAKHLVENIRAHHCFRLLNLQVTGSQTRTDDSFIARHRRFDQSSSPTSLPVRSAAIMSPLSGSIPRCSFRQDRRGFPARLPPNRLMIRHIIGNPDPKITPLTKRGLILRPILHRITDLGDLVAASGVEFMRHEQAFSDGREKFEGLYAIKTNLVHQSDPDRCTKLTNGVESSLIDLTRQETIPV